RRRHTRFSRDWSSDVCSSDLLHPAPRRANLGPASSSGFSPMRAFLAFGLAFALALLPGIPALALSPAGSHGWSRAALVLHSGPRSEERRVGKECGSLCARDRD